MRARQIAKACGIHFHKDLHKKYEPWLQDFREDLPNYWFVEYSSEDSKARLFAPTTHGDRFRFVSDLFVTDVEKSIKLVNLFLDIHERGGYDPDMHSFSILSGSYQDFAFASAGAPRQIIPGYHEVDATIDHAKMSNPVYDTFWHFERAKYVSDGDYNYGDGRVGIVKYNDRSYVPFLCRGKIYLINFKIFKRMGTAYDGVLGMPRDPSFQFIRKWEDFGQY